ncbi:hypothetical protein [Pseudobacteriovorax antillogorgiicola]|uniref:Uncharacterized protein n=1 Tax=Pseudobacteriovorax antillogorgiicola TaxID=1513793 RepID=A0A1Y6BL18_9BACT|nr:hypothetical protein [Pseudobacteriovorax antillogorgiicola]TCS54668.1 hypothetical protein EDD56_106181 [Pseudobacteriovorax antillogorgiicola]SMF16738.1 hypothetical protein SAMN06296036_10662 [Pseudobacteriovorax antillogorgiicola]
MLHKADMNWLEELRKNLACYQPKPDGIAGIRKFSAWQPNGSQETKKEV